MDAAQIPSQEKFVKDGNPAELYEGFVAELQEKIAGEVLKAAEAKAGAVKKIRVKGGPGKWRAGQTHYVVPSEAPIDRRVPFMERPKGPGAPGLRLPIGLISAVPIRDERHLECLRGDPNLEFLPDDAMSHDEEKRLQAEAAKRVQEERRQAEAKRQEAEAEAVAKVHTEALLKAKDKAEKAKQAAKPRAAEVDEDDVPPSERRAKA